MRKILCVVFAAVVMQGFAQAPEQEQKSHISVANKWILKLDGADLVHPNDPALTFGVEGRFKKRFAFTQELSWIYAVYETQEPITNFTGIKAATSFRMYLVPYSTSGSVYMGLMADYRYLDVKDRLTVGYGCTGDGYWSCDYLQSETTEITTNRYAGLLKVGVQEQAHPRITIEVDAGVGLGYLSSRNSANGEDVAIFEFGSNEDGALLRSEWSYLFTFNAKIGYVISSYD